MGKNKIVLITGASSGLGKAAAEYLYEKDYIVYGTSRTPEKYDVPFELIEMDITQDSSVKAGINKILEEEGKIDILVNNAGYGLAGAVEDTPIEEAKQQFETNYFGTLRVIQEILPQMRELKNGKIINVCSIIGRIGFPFQGHYSASKFALEGLTEALRIELKPFNIYVTAIDPGVFNTKFVENRQIIEKSKKSAYSKYFKRVISTLGDQDDGADPILFARLIEKIIKKDKPKVRYTTGDFSNKLLVFLNRLFGSNLVEYIMRKYFKLDD